MIFFDLSDLYIFEHLSLHIYFRAKLKNKCTLFFELFLFDRPLLTRDWKSESVTNGPTNLPTNQLTWVGARDTCVSKKTLILFQFLRSETNSRVFKHGWEDVLFVSKHKKLNCGRVFFFNTSYFRGRTSFFGLIHLWRPITPVKNYHIFGKPRTSAFSWYTLFRSY